MTLSELKENVKIMIADKPQLKVELLAIYYQASDDVMADPANENAICDAAYAEMLIVYNAG